MQDLRIGCIGCGFIGEIHLRNAAGMPGLSIRAVADVNEMAARAFYEQFHPEYWTTDAQRLLDDPLVDAVLICTYSTSHAELAIRSAQAGKHIFLEKPMATSSADCLRILQACQQTGVLLSLDLKFRFSLAAQRVKREIPNPVLIHCQVGMDKMPDDHFHMDPDHGGGIIENLGAHSLDLACFLAGSEPAQVTARGSRLADRVKTSYDAVVGTLEFTNGCLASFLISDCGEWSYPSKWFYEITDGHRNATIHNHCRTAIFEGSVGGSVDEAYIAAHEVGSYRALQDFIAAIRDKRPPEVGALDGLRTALIVEGILSSIRCGKAVTLAIPTHPLLAGQIELSRQS
ncbi:MAG: Gfo/Idh/MocA family oxidoreductase [Acidobacteriota bacterium]